MMHLVALVLCVSGVLAMDDYVMEAQQACSATNSFFTCGKYQTAKFISKFVTSEPSRTRLISGVVDFVTMDKPDDSDGLFPGARLLTGTESGFWKFVKFVQRQMDIFLGSRAFLISLPSQARFVDADDPLNEIAPLGATESRVKTNKVSIVVPLIILLKVFKIKVMMALVLGSVIFIKKALIFLFLIAPSYLHMLKICKMQSSHYPQVEEHDFGTTAYSYNHPPHGHQGAYAKDWANSRAYSAQKPT